MVYLSEPGRLQVWEKIDEYMDSRRRDRREKRLEEELKKYRTENPKITEQFADLKRKLADIAESEWEVQAHDGPECSRTDYEEGSRTSGVWSCQSNLHFLS